MHGGIYAIKNKINGKLYVGSAVNLFSRWRAHRKTLRQGAHHSQKFQRAWNKYGEKEFIFHPLLICAKKDLLFYEQRAINIYDVCRVGYNICPIAGSSLGLHRSAEANRKNSIAHTGKKHSAESKLQMSRTRKGKKQTAEHARKRAASRIGVKRSAEICKKISDSKLGCKGTRTGLKWSDEVKAKISASHKGKRQSPEHAAKSRVAFLGRKHSPKTIRKLVAFQRERRRKERLQLRGVG